MLNCEENESKFRRMNTWENYHGQDQNKPEFYKQRGDSARSNESPARMCFIIGSALTDQFSETINDYELIFKRF